MSHSRPEGVDRARSSGRPGRADSVMSSERFIKASRDNDKWEDEFPLLVQAHIKLMRWFIDSSVERQDNATPFFMAVGSTIDMLQERVESLMTSINLLHARIDTVPAYDLPCPSFASPHGQEDAAELERIEFSLLLEKTLPKNTKEGPDVLFLKLTIGFLIDQAQICAKVIVYVLGVRDWTMETYKKWASGVKALVDGSRPSTGTRAELQHLASEIEVLNQIWKGFCTATSNIRRIGEAGNHIVQLEKDFNNAGLLASQHGWANLEVSLQHLVLCEIIKGALEARDHHED